MSTAVGDAYYAPPHVDFILLAEFDIDKGSVVRHQYPGPTHIPESILAESMLPEGAHLRESDWTIFRVTDADRKKGQENAKQMAIKAKASGAASSDNADAPASSFTDTDNNTKKSSTTDAGPRRDFLFCLNFVQTRLDKTVKRGAIVKSICILTRHAFYDVFRPVLMLALSKYFDTPEDRDRVALLHDVFTELNKLDLSSIKKISMTERRYLRSLSLSDAKLQHSRYVSMPISVEKVGIPLMTLTIPTRLEHDEVKEASIIFLLHKFGTNIMKIFTAILAQKRVLFLGYGEPANDISQYVLSSLLLVSPHLTGLLERCYPYANLTDMRFLEQAGYIAGVTNPLFETRESWWDLLCNVQTGTVKASSAYYNEICATPSHMPVRLCYYSGKTVNKFDVAFIARVTAGMEQNLGEEWVRSMFSILTESILDLYHQQQRDQRRQAAALEQRQRQPEQRPQSESVPTPSGDGAGQEGGVKQDETDEKNDKDEEDDDKTLTPDDAVVGELEKVLTMAGECVVWMEGESLRTTRLAVSTFRLTCLQTSPQFSQYLRQREATVASSAFARQHFVVLMCVRALQQQVPSVAQLMAILHTILVAVSAAGTRASAAGVEEERHGNRPCGSASATSSKAVSKSSRMKELLGMFPQALGGLTPLASCLFHSDARVQALATQALCAIETEEEGKDAVAKLNAFYLDGIARCKAKAAV